MRQLSKIRDLFNTFSKWGTKFKFSYEIWDQWNNLTKWKLNAFVSYNIYVFIFHCFCTKSSALEKSLHGTFFAKFCSNCLFMIQYMCFYYIIFVPDLVLSKSKISEGRWLPQFYSKCFFKIQYMCFYIILLVPIHVPRKSHITGKMDRKILK